MQGKTFQWMIIVMLCWLCGSVACAQDEGQDVTALCQVQSRSYIYDLVNLYDDDESTVWSSARNRQQYLQMVTPEGGAYTLSVRWTQRPQNVRLKMRKDGAWITLVEVRDEQALPSRFTLPEGNRTYQLLTDGNMIVADIRIETGDIEGVYGETFDEGTPVRAKRMADEPQSATAPALEEESVQATEDLQKAETLDTGVSVLGTTPDFGTMQRTASEFTAFIRSRVGMGYIYGGQGEISSSRVRKGRVALYPEYTSLLVNQAAKWDGMQVYDCVGLVKAFLEQSEGEYPSAWRTNVSGAASRWMTETGPIETMPSIPGLILLQQRENGTFVHMGVYVGDGMCVHARGHVYGVVMEPMPQLWTHWARPSWLTLDMPAEDVPVVTGRGFDVGETLLVDTSESMDLPLFDAPDVRETGQGNGYFLPNHTVVRVTEVPQDAWFWRKVRYTNAYGQTYEGYVNAKELTSLQTLPSPVH